MAVTLKFITQANFTALDFDKKLFDYETAMDAIEESQIYISECRRCGLLCKVSIRDNKTKKTYPFETFERLYGR